MDVFQAEIGCDQGFVSGWNADAGAVIPNSYYSASVSSTGAYAANQRFFGEWQGRPMISEKQSSKLGSYCGHLVRPIRSALKGAKMNISLIFIPALITVIGFAITATAQEKKIQRSELPAEVEKTVVAQSEGATIRGFAKEKENGQLRYEVELMVNGHSKDVLMDSDGSILEVEEQVAIDSLPEEIRAGLQAKAGNGQLLKVESITKHDKLVAYEAQVRSSGKRSEVQVGPDGKPLDHEE
jgi:hypothetical protein